MPRRNPQTVARQAVIEAEMLEDHRVATAGDEEERARAQSSLMAFSRWTYPTYQAAPHLALVAAELEAVERGDNAKLIIEMPPRHGKSELVSIRFPAWALGRDPTRQLISASYSDDLATEMGRQTRNIVDTQSVFPDVRLSPDSRAKNLWHTNSGGQYKAVGIGSGVVGWGGHIITVDDPFKKREEAESLAMRDHIWNWWTSEILTRRERGTALIVVMHRWHEDDLVGRLLTTQPGSWRVVRLPAIAEKGDLMQRKPGAALWPWRATKEELSSIRSEVGERNWNSLYQQRPAPDEGDVFKWWPTYKALPTMKRLLMPIDTAYTDTSGSDYTAWTLWWDDGSRIGIIDAQRRQMEIPEAEREIRRYYENIKREFPDIPVQPLIREKVAIDRAVGQHLRRAQGKYKGMPVVQVKLPSARGEDWKQVNAKIIAPEFEGERMLIPGGFAPWLEEWLEEHKQFPAALHDDWVETTLIVGRYRFRRDAFQAPIKPIRVYTGWQR